MNKNSFAPRPPMGWNSYDYYDTNVTEAEVIANAEYMAANLKEFGWEYIVVDIQWYGYGTASMRDKFQYIPFAKKEMDEYGRLLPCPEKFPSSAGGKGFKPLADKIHALGLKFGIHIMRGIPRWAAEQHLPILGTDVTADMAADPSSICPWNPDMYGLRAGEAGQAYYNSILELYASWGVDYIKCDDICATGFGAVRSYGERHEVEMLAKAIQNCGRPIVLSLSPGPALIEESWHYEKYANMWRITDDFWDNWKTLEYMFDRCEKWQDHVKPGCWPDCDMLPLGKVGKVFGHQRDTLFTKDEQKNMMTLWCIFGSPLMLGAEMTMLDEWTLSLLQNRDLLRLENGHFVSKQVLRSKEKCVWAATDPKTGECYVALFNLSGEEREVSVSLEECAAMFPAGWLTAPETVKEIWSGDTVDVTDTLSAHLPPHGTALFMKLQ